MKQLCKKMTVIPTINATFSLTFNFELKIKSKSLHLNHISIVYFQTNCGGV